MKKTVRLILGFMIILLSGNILFSNVIPFTSKKWDVSAKINKLENFMGKDSLCMLGGIAYIKDSDFTDGIIEFDVNFSEKRGFIGVIWRMQDKENYEEFYIRPHQSGNPDANQYTPVYNGLSGWQLYHGSGYGAPVKYAFNKWMHIKLIISGKRGEVYIDNMHKPRLVINDMKRKIRAGKIGLKVNNFSPAYFSNFSFKTVLKPEMFSKMKVSPSRDSNIIYKWLVSNNFSKNKLDDILAISDIIKKDLIWKEIDAEISGTVNLARVNKYTKNKNTVFTKIIVYSDKNIVKKISFGYSDLVKFYFNDKLLYSGNNRFRSRDYRYLGTIGYFDNVYLPLKKGKNELWFAITENFGGWGIKAKFESMTSIHF